MSAIKGVLVVTVFVTLFVNNLSASIHPKIYRTIHSFRKCLTKGYPLMCVKEASLQIVNETLVDDKPMMFYDMIEIGRNPNYNVSDGINENLPTDLTARSIKLDEILHEKIENYFKSRTIKFIMAPAVEGEVEEFTDRSLKEVETKSRSGKDGWDGGYGSSGYGVVGGGGGGGNCKCMLNT